MGFFSAIGGFIGGVFGRTNNTNVKKDWEETYGDSMQKLVFIGHDLYKEAITKAIDKCLTEF